MMSRTGHTALRKALYMPGCLLQQTTAKSVRLPEAQLLIQNMRFFNRTGENCAPRRARWRRLRWYHWRSDR